MFYRWDGKDLFLDCTIQAKSKETCLLGVINGALKIRLSAPPVDGKANKQLIKFLAKEFQVKQSAITIVQGETSRLKKLCIKNPKTLPKVLAISED